MKKNTTPNAKVKTVAVCNPIIREVDKKILKIAMEELNMCAPRAAATYACAHLYELKRIGIAAGKTGDQMTKCLSIVDYVTDDQAETLYSIIKAEMNKHLEEVIAMKDCLESSIASLEFAEKSSTF